MKTETITLSGRDVQKINNDLQAIISNDCYDLPVDAVLSLCADGDVFCSEWRRFDNAIDVVQRRHGERSAPYIEDLLSEKSKFDVYKYNADISDCHVPIAFIQTILFFKEGDKL